MPMDELDPNLLYSPILKIALKPHCITATEVAPTREVVTSAILKNVESEPTQPAEFFIHKALLASLSPELHKHVNNQMREGQEGIIELSDVEQETFKAFLFWAYAREYRTPNPESPSSLLYHTKLYVFADRFNIAGLSDLSLSKVTTLLVECGMVASPQDITSVTLAIAYACANLPFSTVSSSASSTAGASTHSSPAVSGLPSDRLLRYFTQYATWTLDSLRNSREFIDLLSNSHDFAIAVAVNSSATAHPPWISSPSAVAGSANRGLILRGSCKSCTYSGPMKIRCPDCKHIGDVANATVTGKGISGTSTHYEYTCVSCSKVNEFMGPRSRTIDRPMTRYWRYDNIYYLHCVKCSTAGKDGKLELIHE
ncbi:hypothetical protein BDZ91DRAFT_785494 [Kalaharituber pfeilii]|nr:hypothetical protein BDZ91DRAFT_785494 [Kalaharituber pfeilii]